MAELQQQKAPPWKYSMNFILVSKEGASVLLPLFAAIVAAIVAVAVAAVAAIVTVDVDVDVDVACAVDAFVSFPLDLG